MRITTWNVNGIRALVRKGSWSWVEESLPDMLCLQEIKARPEQLEKESNKFRYYDNVVWNPAVKPGYSGVATFIKGFPFESVLGMGSEEFDVEGRVVQTRIGTTRIFNIYFPNGQRDHERLTYKLDFYAYLLDYCMEIHQKGEQIILCGDFNTAHNEIDLKNPASNAKTSGFMPEERAWIDKYIEHGFVDIYRQLYPDRVQYTWWTYISNARARNVGWRLDYFLISPGLMTKVNDVTIHDEVMGSDHCPVTLDIDLS